MSQPRNAGPDAGSVATLALGRPLSARSVLASTLLGVEPPRLPTRLLVASGELFGIAEGATRVAISRMVAAGELVPEGDGYHLAGPLLARQDRQRASRVAEHLGWNGRWTLAVVRGEGRSAAARAELREALRRLKMAELREGVWLRPDNLDRARSPEASALVSGQCRWFESAEPAGGAIDLSELWDLEGWARTADELRVAILPVGVELEAGATEALATGFVLSAAVLRHLLADPLLPLPLLPANWPGADLRAEYERYDRAFKALWREWFGRQG
jgi:phenylacetic acid degradation operon negative regulatory protein